MAVPSLAGSAPDPLTQPVPAGATRVLQFVEYRLSVEPVHQQGTFDPAEYLVSQFDALRLPINIVACDTRGVGAPAMPADMSQFVMVLDVRNEDLPLAGTFGFVALTAQTPAFSVINNGS